MKKRAFEVGQKVVVTDRLMTWHLRNPQGEMDHWIGKTMTIESEYDTGANGEFMYKMAEGKSEHSDQGNRDGWQWGETILELYVEPDVDPDETDVNIFQEF